MKQEAAIKKNIVPFLFLLSVAVRFLLGNYYPKTMNCYPDELLYLSGASSLWNQHQMLVFQMPSDFARIGYCLLIAPAFAFTDMKIRGMVIALVNAVLVSLGIFPVYGMARRILSEKKYIELSLVLYLICPTMTYSMTYMSENLYLPVALTMLYVLLRLLEEKEKSQKVVLTVIYLVLVAVAYFIKSVALAFLVALVLLWLTELLASREKKKIWSAVGIFGLGIVASVVVIKTGMIEWNPQVVQTKGLYILFGTIFFILISILAFCVIPVFMPGLMYRSMEEREKKFYLFLLYLILSTALVVSAMIYAVEDYPSLTPRAHVRYVEFAFVPLVMLVFHLMEKKAEEAPFWKVGCLFGGWTVMQLALFRGFSGQTVDQTMLFYWQLIAKEGKYFSLGTVRALSVVIILVAFGLMMLYGKNRDIFKKIFVVGILLMCLGNTALSVYVQYKTHTHSQDETAEAEVLRTFVRENENKSFWVLEPEGFCELIDTYLIDCENVRTGTKPVLSQKKEQFTLPTKVDYMVVYDEIEDSQVFNRENATLYQSYPALGYSVYQMNH